MTINEHTLVHAKDAGNGYHGWCKHCNVSCETDLGWCSWDGVKCIDRVIDRLEDFPETIRSFVNFNGLRFNGKTQIFVKPYGGRYTVSQIEKKVKYLLDRFN